MKRVVLFAAMLTLLPLAAQAQNDVVDVPFDGFIRPQRQVAPENLPFGFSTFYWGMSQADVATQGVWLAPAIKAPEGSPVTNQASYYIGPYRWKECTFNVSFHFGSRGLTHIDLIKQGVAPTCLAEVQDELMVRYGEGRKSDYTVFTGLNKGKKFGEQGDWGDDQTLAGYSSMGNWAEIGLSQKGGEPLVGYDVINVDRSALPP